MEIFVRSSGYAQECGYRWLPNEPPDWSSIANLIESESLSIVLTKKNGNLNLFVTGLESLEKRDFRDRQIRHSVVWVYPDNVDNEKRIRAIAAQALRGLISSRVDECIDFGGEFGFEVTEDLTQIILNDEVDDVETRTLDRSEEFPQIGKNIQELRDDLAFKLQHFNLPQGYEFLVVVTGNKAEQALERVRIWRSLSNLIRSEDWKTLPKSEANQLGFIPAALMIAAVVIMVIIAALILLSFLSK